MPTEDAEIVRIELDDGQAVSGLLQTPPRPLACLALAHGAGAGMRHPFLSAVAAGLAERSIATLRYQFPYMERGSRRPDQPQLAQATVRAALAAASRLVSSLPLFAGGKSFGGRMTSQAQAESPLHDVRGLVFLGFPLHPPGRLTDGRGKHLFDVQIPMLFLQGTRDDFASLSLLHPLIEGLGEHATLELIEGADHSFHVPVRGGRKNEEILAGMLEKAVAWMESILGRVKQ